MVFHEQILDVLIYPMEERKKKVLSEDKIVTSS
jgi:hypothetical protein